MYETQYFEWLVLTNWGLVISVMGINSVNLSQKELEDIEDVLESIKELAGSFLKEHKWAINPMGSCLTNFSDNNEWFMK